LPAATSPSPLIERRLRWSGFLIALGLIVQLTTFIWIHPLAFIAFAVISCPLTAAGILLFLYSLVSHQASQDAAHSHPTA
jgi:fatty-acid desaturase